MHRYQVNTTVITAFDFQVEADSPEEAREVAERTLRDDIVPSDLRFNGYDIDVMDIFRDDDEDEDEDEDEA